MADVLDGSGFLRVADIIGDKRRGIPALIPISRTQWWRLCRDGKAPQPIKIGERVTVWRAEDIRAFIERAGRGEVHSSGNSEA